jgi:hypothetical protein
MKLLRTKSQAILTTLRNHVFLPDYTLEETHGFVGTVDKFYRSQMRAEAKLRKAL